MAFGMTNTPGILEATEQRPGLMNAADKTDLNNLKDLALSVDAQGYVCQTIEEA